MASDSLLGNVFGFLAQKKGPFRCATYIGSAAVVGAFAYRYYSQIAVPPEL
jgi:hypothetical protein